MQQLQAIETAHSSYHVRRGTCTAGRGKIKPIEVTIKSIEGPGTGRVNDALRELLREIAAVSQFNHSNVVSLIGVVWKGTPLPGHPLALYEHMSHGLLDRYLRKTKPSLERRLAMCTDVVSGVNYLASVNYVLGNLSAKVWPSTTIDFATPLLPYTHPWIVGVADCYGAQGRRVQARRLLY